MPLPNRRARDLFVWTEYDIKYGFHSHQEVMGGLHVGEYLRWHSLIAVHGQPDTSKNPLIHVPAPSGAKIDPLSAHLERILGLI